MRYFEHNPANPVLSVLLPSRSRFSNLQNTIDSLAETVSDKKNVEVIVKFDDDDVASHSRISEIRTDISVKCLVSSRRNGYASLHEFSNEMLSHVTGTWVVFMNDDSFMATPNFDNIILDTLPGSDFGGRPDFACLNPIASHSQFPIVTSSACKKLGYFALHNHVDSFLQDVYGKFSAGVEVALHIGHYKSTMTDEIADSSNAAAMITSPTYGPFINANILQIIQKIKKEIFNNK